MKIKILFLLLFFILFVGISSSLSEDELLLQSNQLVDEMKSSFDIDFQINIKLKGIKGSAEAHRFPFIGYEIVLGYNNLKEINENELKGLLAHELAHIKDYMERNWISMAVLGARYIFSKNYRRNLERETDLEAIKAGYGEELIAFKEFKQKFADEKELKRYNELYLSIEEAEIFMEEIAGKDDVV